LKAKHSNNLSIFKKIIIVFFIILLICSIYFFMQNKKERTESNISNNSDEQTNSSVEVVENINMPDKIENYNVLGKIVIDKVGIEQYILEVPNKEQTMEALELGVIKFYAPDFNLNEPGNFCIEGHNYQEIFGHLMNIEKDDTFYIIDKTNSKKVTYKIYDKYTVYPDNLDSLNQETNDKREVTLITCTPGNLTRLIIKAREI